MKRDKLSAEDVIRTREPTKGQAFSQPFYPRALRAAASKRLPEACAFDQALLPPRKSGESGTVS